MILLWSMLVAAGPPVESAAARVARLESDAEDLAPRLSFLTGQYLNPEVYEGNASIDARVSDGEILSLLGDYARASIVLYDVVARPENKASPLYDRALFTLAEAQYQTRDYYGARSNFQTVIERGDRNFLFEAFGRLVEIADVIHDYSGVEACVAQLRNAGAGALRPDVAYHYGKSLERRGESALAKAQLLTVPPGHKFYYRARYIVGVGEARQGHYQAALPFFLEAAQAKNPLGSGAKADENAHFSELAWMAMARLFNELDRSAEALDAYQNVGQQSPYFDDMLYEVAWNFVGHANKAEKPDEKKLNFQKALDALDLLLLSETERALMPEARLLKGNVLLKLDRPDEAETTFDAIINRYGSTKIALDKVEVEESDPVGYFDRLIAKNQGVFNAAAFLPPLAVPLVSGEHEVSQALGIANDLAEARASIDEGRVIAEKLRAALHTRRAVELYPRLQEGESRSIELEANTMVLFERAVALEREIGAYKISRADWPPLDALAREKDQAARAYRALPATRGEIQARRRAREDQVRELANSAYRLRYDLQGQRAQLVAAQIYVNDREAAHQIDKSAAAEARRQVKEALAEVGALEAEEKQLEIDAENERTAHALSNDPRGDEEEARRRYVESLARELAAVDDVMQNFADDNLQRLHAVRQRLLGYTQALGKFRASLDDIVAKKAEETLHLVDAEAALLTDNESELKACEHEAQNLVGAVAYRAFEIVRGKFHQLMLKADVGGIDVAWEEKEEQTQAINRLVGDQKDALKALDADFEDVRRGEDGS